MSRITVTGNSRMTGDGGNNSSDSAGQTALTELQ